MNTGINFPMDGGPLMKGKWYNPYTGDSFEVYDCQFVDNNIQVQTTDGRVLDYNTIQDYVQSDGPVPKMPAQPAPLPPIQSADQITDGLLPEDMALIHAQPAAPAAAPSAEAKATAGLNTARDPFEDEDSKLIRRALDRAKKDPEISVGIKWSKYPAKQIEMLVDLMGVDTEKIVDYYINKINLETLRNTLACEICKFIDNKLSDTSNAHVAETGAKEETSTKAAKTPAKKPAKEKK